MSDNNFLKLEERIVAVLKTVYDPEIPVDVYNLGLADFILEDIQQKVSAIDGVKSTEVRLVFEPEWDKDMMSEEAKLELGLL